MKILVIGLDCATPELLLGEERLENVRCLMDGGCYGRLESIVPPITVPAWMCMATSQDPGSLGVYGFRNRVDHSYDGLGIVNSRSIDALALWDQVAREGKRSVIVGVPPCYPPRKVNGLSVGCFLTPDTTRNVFTHPAELGREISDLVGPYPVDVKNFRTHNKSWLKEEIYAMSRKHFAVVRHLLRTADWDYLQFVEIGLDRLQHGFWKYHDPEHVLHEPDSPYKTVIRDYRHPRLLYPVRRGMRRFHESRIVLQLSGRKQAIILIVTSRKEEHHGLVSRAVDRGRATRRQRGTVLSSQPPYPRKDARAFVVAQRAHA